MRRFARYLFTLLASLSLAVCLGIGALSMRSYYVCDSFRWQSPRGWRLVLITRGRVALNFVHFTEHYDEYVEPMEYHRGPSIDMHQRDWLNLDDFNPTRDVLSSWRWCGIEWYSRRSTGGGMTAAVIVPHWMIALPAAVLPLLWIARRLRARLRHYRPGQCPTCGYDLRATPHQCPECGRRPSGSASVQKLGT